MDHVSQPQDGFHKCKLLDQEIPFISYKSGGTYTLGALQKAIQVFKVLTYIPLIPLIAVSIEVKS